MTSLTVSALINNSERTQRWSADASLGGATGRGGDYSNDGQTALHVAVADRVLQQNKLAMYVEAGYDWLDFLGPHNAICATSSSGGCRPQFPDIAGPSALAGLLFAPWRRVEARAGIGGGAYSVNGTLVGGVLGQLDAGVFPAAHVGFVLSARFVEIPRYRHDRLTLIPVLVGLRLR